MTIVTTSPEQTFDIAVQLATELSGGDVVCLNGDLGAGKTAFTKGLAYGLGVRETITSPTFTLVNEYTSGRLPLYHFDVYRLERPDDVEDTAFFDYFGGESVVVIEWATQIEAIIKDLVPTEKRINITIQHDIECEQSRRITINRFQDRGTL